MLGIDFCDFCLIFFVNDASALTFADFVLLFCHTSQRTQPRFFFFAILVSVHNRELGTSSPWAVFWQLFATMGGQTAGSWEWYSWLGVW